MRQGRIHVANEYLTLARTMSKVSQKLTYVLRFCFTADRLSVEIYPSNLLSNQPLYSCICIYFFLSFLKTSVCDNLIMACQVAGVVVCPRNICLSIPKVDRPLFLKPSRLTVRFFIRRTCWFKVLFQFRSIPKSMCRLMWCEESFSFIDRILGFNCVAVNYV